MPEHGMLLLFLRFTTQQCICISKGRRFGRLVCCMGSSSFHSCYQSFQLGNVDHRLVDISCDMYRLNFLLSCCLCGVKINPPIDPVILVWHWECTPPPLPHNGYRPPTVSLSAMHNLVAMDHQFQLVHAVSAIYTQMPRDMFVLRI